MRLDARTFYLAEPRVRRQRRYVPQPYKARYLGPLPGVRHVPGIKYVLRSVPTVVIRYRPLDLRVPVVERPGREGRTATAPRRFVWRRAATTTAAVTLLAAGVVTMGHAMRFDADWTASSTRLTRMWDEGATAADAPAFGAPDDCSQLPPSRIARADAPHAVLHVPRTGLRTAVLEGADRATLDRAVGHLPDSRWPDQGGTTVLEGHDITYFNELDRLRPGDTVEVQGACRTWTYEVTGTQVVKSGHPVRHSEKPELKLVTCWPIGALFPSDERYVVSARLVREAATADRAAAPAPAAVWPRVVPELPPGTRAEDFAPERTGMPLGRLSVSRELDEAYRQGPHPLQVERASVRVVGAALRALAEDRPEWWHRLAPGVPLPAEFTPGTRIGWQDRAAVEVEGYGERPTGARLTARVELAGRSHLLTVRTRIDRAPDGAGAVARIKAWHLEPLAR
ncbi:class D sortase [Streptomyces sp. NPDC001941]|uniref:class D sortase n=1 Tax=Streptomyces sp. NPDC001941 TaxID=3154659 RepID=UPI0033205E88